jgi:hypothetical protein
MNLKPPFLFMLIAVAIAAAVPARAERITSVIGLVHLTNYQAALLAITDSPPDSAFVRGTHRWVTVGQSFDDLHLVDKQVRVNIRQIDFANASVQAGENNADTLYPLAVTNLAAIATGKNLVLNQADLNDTLDLYATLKDRTILVHPRVKSSPVTLVATARSRREASTALENALQADGAKIIADGDKFEWIVPADAANSFAPANLPARPPAKESSTNHAASTLPAGSIRFIQVGLPQFLDVYSALTDRKWTQHQPLPIGLTFAFHNQTPMTKDETLHAFDVLLAWHGLKVVKTDDKSFELAPITAEK